MEEILNDEIGFISTEPRFRARSGTVRENVALILFRFILLHALERDANSIEIKQEIPHNSFKARFFQDGEARGEIVSPHYDKIREYLAAQEKTQVEVGQLLQDLLQDYEAPQEFCDVLLHKQEKIYNLKIETTSNNLIVLKLG